MANQHVTHRKNGEWAVIAEGNTRASSLHDTQTEAIARARELAIKQHSELLIHNKENIIRQKNSYGNDPYPPKG